SVRLGTNRFWPVSEAPNVLGLRQLVHLCADGCAAGRRVAQWIVWAQVIIACAPVDEADFVERGRISVAACAGEWRAADDRVVCDKSAGKIEAHGVSVGRVPVAVEAVVVVLDDVAAEDEARGRRAEGGGDAAGSQDRVLLDGEAVPTVDDQKLAAHTPARVHVSE